MSDKKIKEILFKKPECDYIYDEGDMSDLNDCISCKREKERTCPFGIYNDTVIFFGKEN